MQKPQNMFGECCIKVLSTWNICEAVTLQFKEPGSTNES